LGPGGPCWVILPPRNWKKMFVLPSNGFRDQFSYLKPSLSKYQKLVIVICFFKRMMMMIWWRAINTQKWIILFLCFFILFFSSFQWNECKVWNESSKCVTLFLLLSGNSRRQTTIIHYNSFSSQLMHSQNPTWDFWLSNIHIIIIKQKNPVKSSRERIPSRAPVH
jgi:hypothetical protein